MPTAPDEEEDELDGWSDVEELLRESATNDLEDGGEINPCLVACHGERRLLLAYLRPFAKGAYHDPLIELLSLAAPLGADRIAVSFGARAWSLEDPVPPVCKDGDLRQRVLAIEAADAHGRPAVPTSTMLAFDLVDGEVVWGERMHHAGQTGWINGALAIAVRELRSIAASRRDLRIQAERCGRLGHQVYLSEEEMRRLYPQPPGPGDQGVRGVPGAAEPTPCRPAPARRRSRGSGR